jgi:hypothetical protein
MRGKAQVEIAQNFGGENGGGERNARVDDSNP